MINVLHISAHLGGGVGKAIGGVFTKTTLGELHTVVCIEIPEKDHCLKLLNKANIKFVISPTDAELSNLVKIADIVQIEWWNHPAIIARLIKISSIPLRLVVWSHVSGITNPIIPNGLLRDANKVVFTSSCSLDLLNTEQLKNVNKNKFSVISSAEGIQETNLRNIKSYDKISACYIGTLNFSKLHPNYLDYLAAINADDFCVSMYGDDTNRDILLGKARSLGRSSLVVINEYSSNIKDILMGANLFPYLLNPLHFGTAENSLIEAMSTGVVPIVLNNYAELSIVDHMETGLVVSSPEEFNDSIGWLKENPEKFRELGLNASEKIGNKYSYQISSELFSDVYKALMLEEKRAIDFSNIFGLEPSQWFLSCQLDTSIFGSDGGIFIAREDPLFYSVIDENKGSVRQFFKYFPENELLELWVYNLKNVI